MFKEWLTKLRYLLSPKQSREIDEELRFHIERQTQAYVESGITLQEARRKAALSFGGIGAVKAQTHEQRPSFSLETLAQDLHYAIRQLQIGRAHV